MSYSDGQEHHLSRYCSFKVAFNPSSYDGYCTLSPVVSRWDAYTVNNSGGYVNDGINEPDGSWGFWSGISFPEHQGWVTLDEFATRTYSRKHYDYTIHLAIEYYNVGTYAGGWINYGNGSADWAITIPALSSWTVTFNANGGENAPSAITKWKTEQTTLPSSTPTRNNYKFLGWAKSKTATIAAYKAGGTYWLDDANTTLYAVWELVSNLPTQTVTVGRCNADGTPNGEGTHVKATVEWSVDTTTVSTNAGKQIDFTWATSTGASSSQTVEISGASGTLSQVLNGTFDGSSVYSITAKTIDTLGLSTSTTKTIGSIFYTFDIGNKGQSMGLGAMASEDRNQLTIGFNEISIKTASVEGILNDVVISEGTSGNWHYRKWASGAAECFGKISVTPSITDSYAGVYYKWISGITYPFVFTANPKVVATCSCSTGLIWVGAANTNKDTVSILFCSAASNSQNRTLYVKAEGTWK